MRKNELITKVIEQISQKKERLETSFAQIQQHATEAPSAMESHSDKTKFEMHTFGGKIKEVIQGLDDAIHLLTSEKERYADSEAMLYVQPGALIAIREESNHEKMYFLLPRAGGFTIEAEGKIITTLTPETPLAKMALGKKIGDTFTFETTLHKKHFTIINIQ